HLGIQLVLRSFPAGLTSKSFAPPPCFFCPKPASSGYYTLSLHDALPILRSTLPKKSISFLILAFFLGFNSACSTDRLLLKKEKLDRKSTRLNSSHVKISYAVFCLKEKKGGCLVAFVDLRQEPRDAGKIVG